jgi:Na+/H+ antiporter NhaD/arsenite permease-like protein
MSTLIIIIFILGYLAIALEHPIKIDKAASALITGILCWTIYVFSIDGNGHDIIHTIEHGLNNVGGLYHHMYDIANILFFLMGAMTIVELVDAHEGFAVITDKIKTKSSTKLLWIICLITFFFSAALDNLTTTIVMISLLRKLIDDVKIRWIFVGMVVISANAGGAWSPIGDVTTTMLWIKGQLPNVEGIVTNLFIPSFVSMLVPLIILSMSLKGEIKRPVKQENIDHYINPTTSGERTFVFFLGIAGLIFVPIFKTYTHLPPFMGMMLSLGILWAITEVMHIGKSKSEKHPLSVIGVLQKIDTASVLFFLGILLAVGALQEIGHLRTAAEKLDTLFSGNIFSINIVIGLLSSIVDNVPLVAAAQGMYDISPSGDFAANGRFWEFLAFCAGTGGSALIIGSAAGVAAMGLEKIDFVWYLKKISWLAVIGYLSGALVFYLMFA